MDKNTGVTHMRKFKITLTFAPSSLVTIALSAFLILFIHGAIPFLTVPTFGQATVVAGYAHSFALADTGISIYSGHFGYPKPAPMATGLVFAVPAALLIKLGFHPADAYSLVGAVFLMVAFFSARHIGRLLGLSPDLATASGLLWATMPTIWAHAGYSTLSFGIALLPFYFASALRLFLDAPSESKRLVTAANYVIACLVAVFMDGYTFMMFAVGSSILVAYIYFRTQTDRRHLLLIAFPVHVLSFAAAYLLYATYIGKSQFEPASLDWFRGFGVNVSFLLVPTRGFHWLWDALGLSSHRNEINYFGDASVWTTTFALPLLVVGIVAWWRVRGRNRLATGFLLLTAFGFYMALGPSLKIDSTRPQEMVEAGQLLSTMPASAAGIPTGNGWLSEYLPGFRNMRAAYRWSALGIFGLWLLLVLWLGDIRPQARIWGALIVLVLTVSNMPDLGKKMQAGLSNREGFRSLDQTLVKDLSTTLKPTERVAFLPYRNDFLANYVAPRLGIRTYNVGGDKILFEAQRHWPATMRQFEMATIDAKFSQRVLQLLALREADAVVLPYVDLLATRPWPVPIEYADDLAAVVATLRTSKYLVLEERPQFAVARLKESYRQKSAEALIEELAGEYVTYPAKPPRSTWVLADGWHLPEEQHVWSDKHAVLNMLRPRQCNIAACSAVLKFSVLSATPERPLTVQFRLDNAGNGDNWAETMTVTEPGGHTLIVPMAGRQNLQRLVIDVPEGTSPAALRLSTDPRVLGIALHMVDVIDTTKMTYPLRIGSQNPYLALTLSSGWHAVEANHAWSGKHAVLNLRRPSKCRAAQCFALVNFSVFAASPQRPVAVRFKLAGDAMGNDWTGELVATKPDGHTLAIPMPSRGELHRLVIDVPNATSPHRSGLSVDPRVLGIALHAIDIQEAGSPAAR